VPGVPFQAQPQAIKQSYLGTGQKATNAYHFAEAKRGNHRSHYDPLACQCQMDAEPHAVATPVCTAKNMTTVGQVGNLSYDWIRNEEEEWFFTPLRSCLNGKGYCRKDLSSLLRLALLPFLRELYALLGVSVHHHGVACLQFALQELLGHRRLHLALQRAPQRTGSELGIVSLIG